MSRAVVCEGCGQRLDVPDDHGRRKFRCPECGVYSELPSDGNQSAAPASGAAGRAASTQRHRRVETPHLASRYEPRG